MSITIKSNKQLTFEHITQLVEMAIVATNTIYGDTAKPSKTKAIQAMVPAMAGNEMLFLAAPVDDESGKVVGFTVGYVAPLLIEEGMGAVSFLTYVDPAYASGGWGEKLVLAFEEWATTRWAAVDLRMELINPDNNEAAARIAESHGWKRQGILMLKRKAVTA